MPVKFREDLGECFYVTKGLDGCLFVLSGEGWKGLQEKIQSMPLSKSRGLQRFFFSGATDVETDKQGRILIPQPLRDHAGLTKDVTFVGVSSRVEIWDTSRWNQVNGELTEESIADGHGRAGNLALSARLGGLNRSNGKMLSEGCPKGSPRML